MKIETSTYCYLEVKNVENGKLKETINDYVNYKWIFPEKEKVLINFILDKANIGKKRIRFNSIIKENLNQLSKILEKLFKIESKVYHRVNGLGNQYYELVIHKKEGVKKFNFLKET